MSDKGMMAVQVIGGIVFLISMGIAIHAWVEYLKELKERDE